MRVSRKRFLFVVLLVIGVFVYKSVRSNPSTQPEQLKTVSRNTKGGNCAEQIKNKQSNNIEPFNGNPHSVNFTTIPQAKLFYTAITKAVLSGPNFAGHYTIASWGCGTDCVGYAVVDIKNGDIISYNPGNEGYYLGNFSKVSTNFVLEPISANQERKFYMVIGNNEGKRQLELTCTEMSTNDKYQLPE